MPYPLPEKPYDESDFDYFLVAIPKGIGFHRAFFGHYSDMGSARFWGEEGIVKPDSYDAAQRALQAIAKTLELYDMGWPELTHQYIDNLEALLQELIERQCCSGTGFDPSDFLGSDPLIAPTDDFIDQTGGDVIRNDGATSPSGDTWGNYDVNLCAEATAFVDETIPRGFEILESLVGGITSFTIAFVVTAAAAMVAVTGIAVPAVFLSVGQLTVALEIIRALVGNDDTLFDTYAAEMDAAREELICAIMGAVTPAAAAMAVRAVMADASPKGYDWLRSTFPIDWFVRRLFNEDTDTDGSGGFGGPGGDCSGCGSIYDYTLAYDCCTRDRWSYWNHDASGCRFWVPAGAYTDLGLLGDDLELEIEDYVGAAITAATVERVTVTVNELTAGHFSSNPISCTIVRGAGDTYTEQLVAGENVIINGNPNGTEAYIGNVYITVQFPTTGNFEITEIKIEGDVTLA